MGMRPPPYPKKIERSEKIFYHFKIDASTYALFDSTLSTPIAYGSFNIVGGTVTNLPVNCTIFYFELDATVGWKMKKKYKSNNQPEDSVSAKTNIEKKIGS